jgi:2-polyprenyl-6-methoxyphenol hydroxylase-like FAD-dependent oxidoreductase
VREAARNIASNGSSAARCSRFFRCRGGAYRWSVAREEEAERIVRLGGEALYREVQSATRAQLGDLKPVTPAPSYPLPSLAARRLVGTRVALMAMWAIDILSPGRG